MCGSFLLKKLLYRQLGLNSQVRCLMCIRPSSCERTKRSLAPCLVAARSPGWVCWRPHLAGTRQYYDIMFHSHNPSQYFALYLWRENCRAITSFFPPTPVWRARILRYLMCGQTHHWNARGKGDFMDFNGYNRYFIDCFRVVLYRECGWELLRKPHVTQATPLNNSRFTRTYQAFGLEIKCRKSWTTRAPIGLSVKPRNQSWT